MKAGFVEEYNNMINFVSKYLERYENGSGYFWGKGAIMPKGIKKAYTFVIKESKLNGQEIDVEPYVVGKGIYPYICLSKKYKLKGIKISFYSYSKHKYIERKVVFSGKKEEELKGEMARKLREVVGLAKADLRAIMNKMEDE